MTDDEEVLEALKVGERTLYALDNGGHSCGQDLAQVRRAIAKLEDRLGVPVNAVSTVDGEMTLSPPTFNDGKPS
jgi:hypothetical protein